MTDDTDETFERQMARFAKALQQKAAEKDTPLPDATNAFKALTAYYAILRRYPGKPVEEDDVSFDELQDEVRSVVAEEAQQNGTAPIRSSLGRGRIRTVS